MRKTRTGFIIYTETVGTKLIKWADGIIEETNGAITFEGIVEYLLSSNDPDAFNIIVWDYYAEYPKEFGAPRQYKLTEYKKQYME